MAGERSSTTEVLNFRPTHAPVKHFSLNIVYRQPREGGSILWTMRSNGTISPLLAHTREMKTFSWRLVAGYSPPMGEPRDASKTGQILLRFQIGSRQLTVCGWGSKPRSHGDELRNQGSYSRTLIRGSAQYTPPP
jgi:hypothetical protein